MSTDRRTDSTSVRWPPDAEAEFMSTLRQLQGDGEVPTDIERSEAIRRVLDGWSDDPDPDYLTD